VAAQACNFVRNGQIGKVQRVDIWHPNNYVSGTKWGEEKAPPPELNWDMWLGPLRWRPYNPETVHFNFRWMMDSGGGFVRDRGNHALSIVLWCLGQDDFAGPVTVSATGTPNPNSVYDVPETMRVTWTFTRPDWVLTWNQPGEKNPRFPGEWGGTYTGDKDSSSSWAATAAATPSKRRKTTSLHQMASKRFWSPSRLTRPSATGKTGAAASERVNSP
jgi:predicted dehydrogenase